MLARVTMMQGKPEKLDEVIRYFRETVLPSAKKINGFKEGYMFVNRQTGRVTGMTIWESQPGIQDSAGIASGFIPEMAKIIGATQNPMVDVYEVSVAEVLSSASMK
jgi:hypothetical protein